MARKQFVVRAEKGQTVGEALITVYLHGTSTKASIYSDTGMTVEKENPFYANSDGEVIFDAAPGVYDIEVEKSGVIGAYTIRGVSVTTKVETWGKTSAIATGTQVAHGMGETPDAVIVTPAESGPTDWYVSALGATYFTINFSGGGTKMFFWHAMS